MSELIELLSDLALLQSNPPGMEQRPINMIFNIKNQLDDYDAEFTMSANLAAISRHNDEYYSASTSRLIQPTMGTTNWILDYHQNTVHHDELGSLSKSTESCFDPMHAPSLQASLGLGVPALTKSSESRPGATDGNRMQANSNGFEPCTESRFETMNGHHAVTNALKQGLPTPQLVATALKRPPATGPYYNSAQNSSASSSTSAGLSTIPLIIRGITTQDKRVFPVAPGRTSGAIVGAISTNSTGLSNSDLAISGNATQMKRALSEASTSIAAGRAQKKAKGDMDPENHEIYRLRQENKHFDEIAEIINIARSENGKPSNLTGNAIYGRYKRNATLIAAARGEFFKPCNLDLHAGTNLKVITKSVPTDFDDNEDKLLVEAYKYVTENGWLLVSKRLEETTGRVHNPADCASRFDFL